MDNIKQEENTQSGNHDVIENLSMSVKPADFVEQRSFNHTLTYQKLVPSKKRNDSWRNFTKFYTWHRLYRD